MCVRRIILRKRLLNKSFIYLLKIQFLFSWIPSIFCLPIILSYTTVCMGLNRCLSYVRLSSKNFKNSWIFCIRLYMYLLVYQFYRFYFFLYELIDILNSVIPITVSLSFYLVTLSYVTGLYLGTFTFINNLHRNV